MLHILTYLSCHILCYHTCILRIDFFDRLRKIFDFLTLSFKPYLNNFPELVQMWLVLLISFETFLPKDQYMITKSIKIFYSWYLYQIVNQNKLRTHEGKQVFNWSNDRDYSIPADLFLISSYISTMLLPETCSDLAYQ